MNYLEQNLPLEKSAPDEYEIHFMVDEENNIHHLLMPVDFLYDQLHEREELFIELKRRIRDYEWNNKKGIG
jgi:hypothetical protein